MIKFYDFISKTMFIAKSEEQAIKYRDDVYKETGIINWIIYTAEI